jgi:hypothetical protein
LRFVLLRGDEAAVQRTAAELQAGLLRPGQRLAWPAQPPHACFVVPLLAPRVPPPAGQAVFGIAPTVTGPTDDKAVWRGSEGLEESS